MIESLKAYLQVAGSISEVTRQRAVEVAKQALSATPAAGVLPVATLGIEVASSQASALADELLAVSRQNRAQVIELVRAEVESVLTRLGLSGQGELEARLASTHARVRELERELASRDAQDVADAVAATSTHPRRQAAGASGDSVRARTAGRTPASTGETSPAKKVTASKTTASKTTASKRASKATAKKATAKKATAQKATAKKATSTRPTVTKRTPVNGTAKKATPENATAKKATPEKATAKKATAKKATAKKAAATKAPAKKSAVRTPAAGSTTPVPTPASTSAGDDA